MEYVVGICIGSVLGLTGAGGSVFAVPLLMYFLVLSPQDAMGVSLAAVAVSALFGVLIRVRSKQIQWLPAGVYAVIGGVFAPLGVLLNKRIDDRILLLGFSVLVIFVALRLWRQAVRFPDQAKSVRSSLHKNQSVDTALCRFNQHSPFELGLPCILGVSLGAVATGILSGLFGVGGGFLIVPMLLFLTGIPIAQAVATSLVVIAVVSTTGFISFMSAHNTVDLALLARVAVGGIAGMGLGVFVGRYIAGPALQKVFSTLMLVMAGLTIFSTW